jgi:hypothetical protein
MPLSRVGRQVIDGARGAQPAMLQKFFIGCVVRTAFTITDSSEQTYFEKALTRASIASLPRTTRLEISLFIQDFTIVTRLANESFNQ